VEQLLAQAFETDQPNGQRQQGKGYGQAQDNPCESAIQGELLALARRTPLLRALAAT
jgi:hypothetical protein